MQGAQNFVEGTQTGVSHMPLLCMDMCAVYMDTHTFFTWISNLSLRFCESPCGLSPLPSPCVYVCTGFMFLHPNLFPQGMCEGFLGF